MIIKWIRLLTIILLTIVSNQNGELVPDKQNVLQKLVNILDEMRDDDGK